MKPAGEPAAAAAAGRQQPSRRNVNNDLKSTLKLAESIRSGSTPPAQTAARPKGLKRKKKPSELLWLLRYKGHRCYGVGGLIEKPGGLRPVPEPGMASKHSADVP